MSREEALAALLRRTKHEVAQARRSSSRELPRLQQLEDALRAELGLPAIDRTQAAPTAAPAPVTYQSRLDAIGVTSLQVKTWALEQGLIPELRRGRVPPALVDAYAAAHADHQNGVNAQA